MVLCEYVAAGFHESGGKADLKDVNTSASRIRRRLPAIWRFSCCLMLMLSVLPAYAKSPDLLPLSAAEQNKPAGTNRPIVPKPERGQLLYENHCLSCHASVVHIRARHKARSLEDVRQWTRRWARELRLPWNEEEIDDVSHYLNARYYHYERP